jgi:hypothetical protein
MRVREARERYKRYQPAGGQVLLCWQISGGEPAEHEALYPSLDVALQTAAILATDPRCRDIWAYDGRRLYDGQPSRGSR